MLIVYYIQLEIESKILVMYAMSLVVIFWNFWVFILKTQKLRKKDGNVGGTLIWT